MTDHSQAMTAKYRQDYQAPLYWIDSIDLDFQLQEPLTRVTAISRLRRNGEHNEPLVLDGEGLVLHSVSVDGVPYTRFEQGQGFHTWARLSPMAYTRASCLPTPPFSSPLRWP